MNNANPKIAIIILNYNGKSDTIECLHSVEKILYSNFEIIVVDNDSKDGSQKVLKQQFPKVTLLENKNNLGFAEGNNVGITYAIKNNAEYIFLLNNDTIVDSHILKNFLSTFTKEPKASILGAKIFRYDTTNTVDHIGGIWDPKKAEFFSLKEGEKIEQVDYVCGCAMMVKKEVFEITGLLEPKFFLIWEESDFCYRARRDGFLVFTSPDSLVWHKISASFVGKKPHMHYFWWRNRLLWISRNCSKKDKATIYRKIIFPQMFQMFKLRFLKSAQLSFLKIFFSHKVTEEKVEKVFRYRAGCQGVLDYFFKRFGNCPAWVKEKRKKITKKKFCSKY